MDVSTCQWILPRRRIKLIKVAAGLCLVFFIVINIISSVSDVITFCDFKAEYPSPKEIRHLPPHPLDVKATAEKVPFLHKSDCIPKKVMPNKNSILLIVKSNVKNTHMRDAIRSTWGHNLPPYVILKFVLGFDKLYQDAINTEAESYGDVIQGDFIDAYRNNTIKTAFTYKFIITNCSQIDLILFLDDDIVIDIDQFFEYVDSIALHQNSHQYIGYRVFEERVERNTNSKWYIPCEEYPYKRWPPFLHGGAYLASRATVIQLYDYFHLVRYYFADDAWLGLVAVLAQISHTDNLLFHTGGKYRHFAFLRESVHDKSEMIQSWQDLKDRPQYIKYYFDDTIRGTKM